MFSIIFHHFSHFLAEFPMLSVFLRRWHLCVILLDWLKQLQLYRCSIKLLHLRYFELLELLKLLLWSIRHPTILYFSFWSHEAPNPRSFCVTAGPPQRGHIEFHYGLTKGYVSLSHLIMSHLFMDRTYGETFPSLMAVRFFG